MAAFATAGATGRSLSAAQVKRVVLAIALGAAVALVLGYACDSAARAMFPLRTDVGLALSDQLQATVGADRAEVDAKLAGHWVPALAATPLTGTPQHRVTPADVNATLVRHDRVAGRYGALLVRSEDYAVGAPGRYLSLAPHAYASKKKAQAWCTRHKLKRARCAPVKVGERAGG